MLLEPRGLWGEVTEGYTQGVLEQETTDGRMSQLLREGLRGEPRPARRPEWF